MSDSVLTGSGADRPGQCICPDSICAIPSSRRHAAREKCGEADYFVEYFRTHANSLSRARNEGRGSSR